jgi:hypothetical protein
MMDRGHRRLLLTSLALIVVLTGGNALAYTERTVTTTVPFYRQAKSEWCWAAVSLMLIRHFHPDNTSSQSSLVFQAIGSTNNVSGSPDYILDNTDIDHDWAWGEISIDTIADNINNNRPIQVDIQYGSGRKHAVIIYGYHQIDAEHNGFFELLYWDPNGFTGTMEYNDFVENGTFIWWGTRYNFRLN